MSRWVRRLTYAVGTLVVLVAALAGFVQVRSNSILHSKFAPIDEPLTVVHDSVHVARGEHIVKSITMCVECHNADLGGKVMVDDPALGRLVAPNLTTGNGGKGKNYTDSQLAALIRHGIRPDSSATFIMPSSDYQHLSDEDVGAVVAYLRSLPSVDRELPATELRMVGRALVVGKQLPPLAAEAVPANRTHAATITVENSAKYGEYVANIAGCTGCHGAALSGGKVPGSPPEDPPAANLTPKGIGHYTDAQLFTMLRTGKRPDGTVLKDAMPWKLIAGMSDDELNSVIKYLRSVPSKEFGVH